MNAYCVYCYIECGKEKGKANVYVSAETYDEAKLEAKRYCYSYGARICKPLKVTYRFKEY